MLDSHRFSIYIEGAFFFGLEVLRNPTSSSIETLASATMASDTVSSLHPDWANLVGEILTVIAKRLSALDYANFSAVCTSWAFIASPENGMPRPLSLRKNQPYLLFSGDGVGNCEQSDFCTLFDYLDNSFQKIHPLPEIRGKWIIGSQFGWLAVVDEFCNPSLLNPFTRAQIELPPISDNPFVDPIYDSEGSLTGYKFYTEKYTLEQARAPLSMRKLVLSSNPADGGFEAVAIGPCERIMYMRSCDDEWTMWKARMRHSISDVIYHHGKFLAVTNLGDVYAIDLSWPYDSLKDSLFAKRNDNCLQTRYLLESSGVLLHISKKHQFHGENQLQFLDEGEGEGEGEGEEEEEEEDGEGEGEGEEEGEDEEMDTYETCEIKIQSLDPETGKWIPVTSLDDRSLFIGSWCSMSFLAREISWLKENCIYFMDDYWEMLPLLKEMVRDIGMFNLADDRFETCYPPDLRLTWPPPIWITSPQI